jgi:hypothetical protein
MITLKLANTIRSPVKMVTRRATFVGMFPKVGELKLTTCVSRKSPRGMNAGAERK